MVIFYPHERVSPVQRRQMTTVEGDNIHVVALEGTFDDCQAAVKALFTHAAFRDEYGLSGVNSINWARVLAQVVYYFTSAVALGAPGRKVSYAVPTGNFGDILAGWIAKRMGLPIERLVIATNENDILARALEGGGYETRGVTHTQSPSMDIQVSSNFERLLFELGGRDGTAVRNAMDALKQSRGFTIPAETLAAIRAEFDAGRTSEDDTTAEIAPLLAAILRAGRPAHRRGHPCGARGRRARSRDADGRARHRACRQVPGRDRARDRPAAAAAALHGRHARQAGALHGARERPRPRSSASSARASDQGRALKAANLKVAS